VDAVKHLLDKGMLTLADVQSEVRRYGAEKMADLPHDAFVKCVATLTKGRVAPA
jgi:5-carboxymethyl-2-hydroxymuconate isomerase